MPRLREMTRGRRALFTIVALLIPFALLGILEVGLRIGSYGRDTSLFQEYRPLGADYLGAGQDVAARYFPREQFPPSPPNDVFLAEKPKHAFRVFVLGESSAAGFPYPPNAMFSRQIADVLRDVLPRDTVEVVNLGIAATNSYAVWDFIGEVIEQKPDAVLIYSGHNEYYGALGVGSNESLGSFPPFVRLYLRLQRLKTFVLLRNGIGAMLALGRGAKVDENSPSRMESVARDQRIVLGGPTYEKGKRQFESNLRLVARRLKRAGVPLFVGSLASNLRDQQPLATLSSDGTEGRDAALAFTEARGALARGDTVAARSGFLRARDLDPVRFRAPSEFNEIIRRVTKGEGAYFVPVEEAISAAAADGIPGNDLILEHVHPNSTGYAILGRTFFEAIRGSGVLGSRADYSRMASWGDYRLRMSLSRLDERIAEHEVQTVITRWPFVPFSRQRDYRGTYRPVDLVDSLALAVSRGGAKYPMAKVAVAEAYERRGLIDSAIAEYEGVMRDLPYSEAPYRFAARALLARGENARAMPYLQRAHAIEPTAYSSYSLGVIALRARDNPRAIRLLEMSVRLEPRNPDALYQLSIAYAFARDADRAREMAIRAARERPDYPGIREWLATLGVQ